MEVYWDLRLSAQGSGYYELQDFRLQGCLGSNISGFLGMEDLRCRFHDSSSVHTSLIKIFSIARAENIKFTPQFEGHGVKAAVWKIINICNKNAKHCH